jgi:hypothetical protein
MQSVDRGTQALSVDWQGNYGICSAGGIYFKCRVCAEQYGALVGRPIAIGTADTRALRSPGMGSRAIQRGELGYSIWGTEIFNLGHKGT